ncbi:Hypothetical protein A7982_07869 [Minicystis rosea]|nr:Hypothetical protein A7982_07869 [Minicystis rosea]
MSLPDAIKPAPGRTIHRLEGDWTAVILEPLRGHPYRVLGFFHGDVLEMETDDAAVIRAFMRAAA